MADNINITELSSGFNGKSKVWAAIRGQYYTNVLVAAGKLGLFNILEEKSLTGDEIKNTLELNGRGLYDFLDALVSMELLEREGDGKEARYSNTPEVSLLMVEGSPQYMGGWLSQKIPELKQIWAALPEALKTGEPQRHDMKETGKGLFDLTYDRSDKSKAFIEGMNFAQLVSFRDFVKRFDFSGYNTLCDIGGSNGFFSIIAAENNPHLKFYSFDLPALEPFAKDKIRECGLSDRITVVNGDFFKDDFPRADVVTMGNILHDWGLEEKKLLIKKAYDALPEGGVFVVIECFIDNERRQHAGGLLMSLHMLLITEGGFDNTAADFDSWTKEAGFKRTEHMPLAGDSSAIIAFK